MKITIYENINQYLNDRLIAYISVHFIYMCIQIWIILSDKHTINLYKIYEICLYLLCFSINAYTVLYSKSCIKLDSRYGLGILVIIEL